MKLVKRWPAVLGAVVLAVCLLCVAAAADTTDGEMKYPDPFDTTHDAEIGVIASEEGYVYIYTEAVE